VCTLFSVILLPVYNHVFKFTFVTLHQHNKTPCKLHDLEIKKEKFNEILPSEWSVR